MKILLLAVVIAAVLILMGRSIGFAYEEITALELKEKMAREVAKFMILDVREADEVANCRIPKSVHIPLVEVGKRVNELDREKEIVVYCAAGVRSAKASKVLDEAGFKNVKNLKGGIRSWITAGGTVEGPCK